MKYAADRGILKLQVLGDFKLLIDWSNDKNMIENLVLSSVMRKFVEIKRRFASSVFLHIYWEFNIKVEQFSKDAFSLQKGIIIVQKFRDGPLAGLPF